MKKKIFIGIAVVLVLVVGRMVYGIMTTRNHSPEETVTESMGDLSVEVTYCRPFKKGRLIFGEESADALVPFGKYWRLGANDATEITFSKDVTFAGKPIAAGSYRMYAIPGADKWKVTLNSELDKFGAFQPDSELDVLSVDVPVKSNEAETEQFTIELNTTDEDVSMDFIWDKTLVSVPINLTQ